MTVANRNRTQGRLVAILALATLALMFAPFQASAAPIVGPPTPISAAGGKIVAIYAFADANDASRMDETVPFGIVPIFCNHPTPSCAVPSVAGATLDLGVTPAGPLVFSLTDFTAPNTFFTNAANPIDGDAHDLVSPTAAANNAAAVAAAYLIYGVGAIPAATAASIAALGLADPLTTVTFIGWEDRIFGDYDYNDLIFGFTNISSIPTTPVPGTLLLLGAGLVGAVVVGRMRLRRKATK